MYLVAAVLLTPPVRVDLQEALAGVVGEASGDVPDPVSERVRIRFFQVVAVVEAKETGPGGQVGGDVRRDDPAAVDLPCLLGRFRRPMALAVRTPPVSTTACSRCTTSMHCG